MESTQRYIGERDVRGRWRTSPTDKTWSNFNQGYAMASWPSYAAFSAADELILQQKLLERVKGHKFNLAVAAAEIGKATSMVVDTLGTFGRSFNHLKHGNFAAAARALGVSPRGRSSSVSSKDAARKWLELQYGWRPLVGDCFEAWKAVEAITVPPRRTSVRAGKGKSRTVTISGGTANSFFKTTGRQKRTRSIRYEFTESLSAARQLGLTNPASVLWEILPYSFVVDWFYPVGSYLDNYAQIPKLVGRFMTSNAYLCDSVRVETRQPNSWPNAVIQYDALTQVNVTVREVSRTVANSLNPPMPSITIDGLEKGQRVWNAIALARVAFRL